MTANALEQAHQLVPPRRGSVWAVTVDSTARAYNIGTLTLGGFTPDGSGAQRSNVCLALQAETADIFFFFDSATGSGLDDTAAQAAGAGTATLADTHAIILKAGNPPIMLNIQRNVDKFIQVKAASTSGILRMWVVSESR